MPIYELHCTKCKEVEDRVCSVADRNDQLCEKCSGTMVQEITSTGKIHIPGCVQEKITGRKLN